MCQTDGGGVIASSEAGAKGSAAVTQRRRRAGWRRRSVRGFAKAVLSVPLVLYFLANKEIGRQYGIGLLAKISLVRKFRRSHRKLGTQSQWQEHLELAASLLRISPTVKGDVIECGCFKGGSSVNLSIVCSLVGRRLVICDSFEGLPEPTTEDRTQYSLFADHYDVYERGLFCAPLEEVKANLARFGRLDVCEFVVGYFDTSMVDLGRTYALAFFDADLVESLKPCLKEIWPHLQEGCRMYVHEARSMSLVSLFFDRQWWNENLMTNPPGLVGAGTGLPLLPIVGSELGFALKGAVGSGDSGCGPA